MRVYLEIPPEWGPIQQIATRWRDAGYTVAIVRYPGSGEAVMDRCRLSEPTAEK